MTWGLFNKSGVAKKASLSRQVFLAFVVACAVVAVVVTAASAFVFQNAFLADEHEQLAGECETLCSLLDQTEDDPSVLASISLGNLRATLVAPDGRVLYDSSADASTLPNHADRPEVAAALADGRGQSDRSSQTVGYVSLYNAQRLESGDVLRISVERAGVVSFLSNDILLLTALACAVVGVSWLVARRLSAGIARPILEIDPAAEETSAPYEELDPLVSRLNDQHKQLICRMSAIQDANDMRREFTSNVTHELKTPIASISGAAELIRDGICRPEDVQDFADRIYKDARRLSSLVSDILMLSKLDETERAGERDSLFGPSERVDLLGVARDVCSRLERRAKKAGVRLKCEGVPTCIEGNARLLDELVKNLVENAIRYNRSGGRVFVWVLPVDGRPTLRVSDTGIGIPEEAQQKVFERFYRVDKGRSRDMGGTGLGLAIVKHAAAFHDADIRLESDLGKGTTITVSF